MTVTKFNCSCGNNDPQKSKLYEGAMGYEALICKVCGTYGDENGLYPADDWSLSLVGLTKDQVKNLVVPMLDRATKIPVSDGWYFFKHQDVSEDVKVYVKRTGKLDSAECEILEITACDDSDFIGDDINNLYGTWRVLAE